MHVAWPTRPSVPASRPASFSPALCDLGGHETASTAPGPSTRRGGPGRRFFFFAEVAGFVGFCRRVVPTLPPRRGWSGLGPRGWLGPWSCATTAGHQRRQASPARTRNPVRRTTFLSPGSRRSKTANGGSSANTALANTSAASNPSWTPSGGRKPLALTRHLVLSRLTESAGCSHEPTDDRSCRALSSRSCLILGRTTMTSAPLAMGSEAKEVPRDRRRVVQDPGPPRTVEAVVALPRASGNGPGRALPGHTVGQYTVHPPSTTMVCPVTYDEASLQRKSSGPSISSIRAVRPRGERAVSQPTSSGSCR